MFYYYSDVTITSELSHCTAYEFKHRFLEEQTTCRALVAFNSSISKELRKVQVKMGVLNPISVISFAISLIYLLVPSAHCVDLVGGREVKYIPTPENWHTAYEICRSQSMQLLTINNVQENEEIIAIARKFSPSPSFWVAATDLGHEGYFVWATTGKKVSFANYGVGQPDNAGGTEHCIEITYRWSTVPVWNDWICHGRLPFFCEETESKQKLQSESFCAAVESCGSNWQRSSLFGVDEGKENLLHPVQ